MDTPEATVVAAPANPTASAVDGVALSSTVTDSKRPYKIKDVSRTVKKAMMAASLEEARTKAAEKFGKTELLPNIHLDVDGTEIDEDDYFQTLEPGTELIAVFPGEQWVDPTQYVTITTRRDSQDMIDCAAVEKIHLKKLVGQLKNNLCSVSVLSEPDLEMLSNMDPNSVADIVGKDFIEQLKETTGRLLFEKRQAIDAIELLRFLASRQGQQQQQPFELQQHSLSDQDQLDHHQQQHGNQKPTTTNTESTS